MSRGPLSGTDNAWRRMGTLDNLTTITGVLWFDAPMSYEDLCDRLEARLLRFDRFTQRVGGTRRRLRRPYWETVEDLDIETHVTHLSLPDPGDEATLKRFVSTLMSRPLDERRPLWEAYLIDDAGGDGRDAVAFRINHSIGDGFALLYVLFGLVDDPEDVRMPMGIVPNPPRADAFRNEGAQDEIRNEGAQDEVRNEGIQDEVRNEGAQDGRAAAEGGTDGRRDAVAVAEDGTDDGQDAPADPDADAGREARRGRGIQKAPIRSLVPSGLLDTARLAGTAVRTGWGLLTQEDEIETSLRGELGTVKRAGWTDEIALDRVKAIGRAHDATVNDVLLAALAGAFRRALAGRGEPVDDRELRVTVPVNLRPMDARDASLGNYFGLAFVPLPIGTPDLDERIDIIHERMDAQKAGIEAYLMYLTLSLAGHAPDAVMDQLLRQFEDQATGVVTNVPGPMDTVAVAGREVTDVMFWVPQANDQGIGISIFSYDGSVRLGIAADANLIPEPAELASAYERELDQLAEAAESE